MIKIGKKHHILAYLAAAVAAISVILAGISKLVGAAIGLQQPSYMSLATVAILFALYFLLEGIVYAAKKTQ